MTARLIVLCAIILLSGCTEKTGTEKSRPLETFSGIWQSDTDNQSSREQGPRPPGESFSPDNRPSERSVEREIHLGSGRSTESQLHVDNDLLTAGMENEVERDITFNFEQASLSSVAASVLGQTLGVSFIIAPGIESRTVTLRSANEMTRGEALLFLAQALRMSGVELRREGNTYQLFPAGERGSGQLTRLVAVDHVAAGEIAQILRPAAGNALSVDVIADQNTLVLRGDAASIAAAEDMISTFDADRFANMSFGMFPLEHAGARAVARELEEILGAGAGEGVSLRFVPLVRLNAVLAISQSPDLVRRTSTWIARLDRVSRDQDRRIFIYHVQNGRAVELAEVLQEVFTSDGNQAARSSAGDMDGRPGSILGTERDALRITASAGNNALIILGTEKEYEVVETALARLDVMPRQVLIEAVVAEVSLTNDLRYGVQWFLRQGDFSATLSSVSTGAAASQFPGFSAVVNGSDIRAVLNALESITTVNVVSSPRIMVRDNETATLQVGDQVPVATQSVVSTTTPDAPTVNTIQFRDTGVILKVTPHINAGGLVQLGIIQEVSDVTQTTTSELNSPTIQQRKFESSVSVSDGETIALGGLIKDRREEGESGIPVMKDIPLIGNLFKTTTERDDRTELIVLITPRVAESREDIRAITNDLRKELTLSLGRGS